MANVSLGAHKKKLMKPASLVLFFGSLITLISAFYIFLLQPSHITILVGLPALLLYILLLAMEISAAPSVYRAAFGTWKGGVTALTAMVVFRIFLILLATNALIFWLNAGIYIAELAVLLFLLRSQEVFQVAPEQITIDRCIVPAVKTVSVCPTCHEVVETNWQSCPYCGTRLPRLCANCGKDLGDALTKCPHCGTEITCTDSLKKTIQTFQALADEDTKPESKATRNARLAEALLKDGRPDEAVARYLEAAELTTFKRKKANFLLRAAVILKNTDHKDKALDLLDKISSLDPGDEVGAQAVRKEILSPMVDIPKESSDKPAAA